MEEHLLQRMKYLLQLHQFEKRMRQIDIVETCHGTSLHQDVLQTFFESVLLIVDLYHIFFLLIPYFFKLSLH